MLQYLPTLNFLSIMLLLQQATVLHLKPGRPIEHVAVELLVVPRSLGRCRVQVAKEVSRGGGSLHDLELPDLLLLGFWKQFCCRGRFALCIIAYFSIFYAHLFYRRAKWDVDVQAALVKDAGILHDLIQFTWPALPREYGVVSMC